MNLKALDKRIQRVMHTLEQRKALELQDREREKRRFISESSYTQFVLTTADKKKGGAV